MRQRLRAVGLFALVIVAITCTDAPTSPTKIKPGASGVANIRMSPTFSPDAARIYSGLAAFGLAVTEVHVVLTGPDGSKKDTVIAFPASQDQITIEIPVPSSGTDQTFDALIELRNDQHVVLFSGHQTVIARAANLPQQTPPLVIISYTGPGKGAKTVTVSPSDTTIAGTATIGIRATAVDSAGLPVTNLLVQFAVSDATLAVATSTGDATGTLTGLGKRGTATLRATTPLGITGSSRITFVPPAARIVVISGNGQTGAAGSALAQPLVVEVQATDNLPVPGASVAFRAVTAGGSVQQTTVIADANGRASTTLTLGTVAGAYVYEAGSGALPPVSVSATATAAPAAAIAIVSGDAQTDTIAKVLPLPFVVKVTDQFGGPVSGATVSWTRTAGNGILGATSTSTNVNGTTSITYTLGATASNDTVRASVAGVTGTVLFSAKAVSRVPATIAILSGGNQSGLPNTALTTPIVARVSDAQNAPIAGATVAWSATGAGATFNPASGTTDAQGQVSTLATLGATPGTTTVTATVGTSTVTTTLTTTTPAQPTLTIVAGDQQSAVAGTTLPIAPSVLLKDGSGNAVPNAPVVFAVVSGGGSITSGTTATNASGVATLGSWTLGTAAGPNTLTATSGSLSVTFTATGTTPAGPNHLVFGQGPPSPFVIGAPPVTISVHLFDGQNTAVPQSGVVVTMTGTASPGPNFPVLTATTDNTGAATFIVPTYNGAPGTVTLDFSATGITGIQTQAIPIVAGTGTKLLIVTQPAATVVNQAPFTSQPVVQLADAAGNPVSTSGVQITATFASGPTTPTPVLIQAGATTNASGQATFSGMAINGAFGVYTLSFSAPGYTSVVSNAITNGPGPANTLLLFGGNGQNAPVSTPVGVPPLAKVIDAQGNGVPGIVVTFNAVNAGSTVSNGPTTGTTVTVTTNAIGVAQLGAWTMSPIAGPHSVTASATVPNGSPVTFTANATAGGGSKFLLVQPLPTQIAVSIAIPAIQVQIADANGNAVAQAGVSVTLTGNVQPSGQGFSLSSTTNAQGIATLQPTPYTGTVGNAILSISANGYTTFASGSIPVVAGPASAIKVTTQPPTTAQSGVVLAPQPVVQVVDDGNNPVLTAGIPINVVPTGATAGGTSTVNTNASGQAAFTNLFISGPVGATTLQFYNPSLTAALSNNITLTAGPAASMSIDAGDNQTAAAGGAVPILPAVLVKDAAGNPVAGVAVLFTAVTPGSFVDDVHSTTLTTNAQGIAQASFFWMLSPTAGPNTLTASAAGVAGSPLTFHATGAPGTAAGLKLLQAVPASITVGLPFPAPVQVQLVDQNDNPVSQGGVTVTATGNVQPSNTTFQLPATTASNGIATFNPPPYIGTIGTLTFTLTAPSVSQLVTSGINVLAGSPSKVVITTQPPATAASGAPFVPQPALQVTDVGSNAVNASANIAATIQTGSGTLGGTSTIATNANGAATFGNLSLSGAPGSFTLHFAATGLTAAVSNTISLGAGGPASITIVAGDQQVAAAGTAVPVAPSVRVADASGTPLSGIAVTFAVTLGGGSTPPSGSLTNASGIATVSLWQLGIGAGTNNLTATAGALSTTFTATAVPGPATQLIFVNPPPPTATSGVPLSVQPAVQRKDQYGNNVSGAFAVTASVLTGTGTLTNATVTTNAGGLAIFTSLTITGTAGTLTLDFNSPGVTHVASSGIALSGGAATTITKNAGDGQTAIVASNVAVGPAVLVTDGAGNPVVGAQVTFTVASGGGVVTGTPATTNASGIAQVSAWQLGNIAGPNSLTATLGALTTTFTATGAAAPPAALSFTTQPPTTATSGAALSPQPIIQVRDAFGNASGASGTVTAAITSGSGTLTNFTATMTSSGLASFSGLAINGSGTFTLQFTSGSLTSVSSQPITITTGPAANIVFGVQPSGGTGGAAITPAFTVRLVDANGNTVVDNTFKVTLTIAGGTGTQGATLTGGTSVTFVNGVATFSTASIDFGGTGYALRATANLLNAQGAPMTSTSNTFTIQPGTGPFLATKAGNRVSVAQVGATSLPTATQPIFVARNAQGQPAPGLTVDVTAFGRCRLLNGQLLPFTTLTYTSDVNGEVTPNIQLPTFAGGSGCLIKATGATFTTAKDSSQIAVFPAQTSHVWTGAANSNWQNAANWIPVISAPSVPSSTSDNIFIPNYNPQGAPVVPVVSLPKPAMNRLSMDSTAILSLGGIGIDVGAGGVTGWGVTNNGSIHIATTATVNGVFDILDAGQSGACGTLAPQLISLRDVQANVLNVRCKTNIDTTTVIANTLNVFPNAGQGWLHLTSARASLGVSGNANFTGDSLWVTNGEVTVVGTTTFGGGVNWSGGTLSALGAATFASDHAFYNTVRIAVQGDATFGGSGAGLQQFVGDTLTLAGNFSQIVGTVSAQTGQTFVTSNDQTTMFVGTAPQTVSFATPTTSSFSVLRLANQSAAGVQLTTNAQTVNGTFQPRVEILLGRLQVNTGQTFTLNSGWMQFRTSTNLNLLGDITGVGQCMGKTTFGATITGGGSFNGAPVASFTCDDDR